MKRKQFLLILVWFLVPVSLTLAQVHPDSLRQAAWQQFRQKNGTGWRIRWSRHTGLPASMILGVTRPYSGTPEQEAQTFLKDHARLFDFHADLSNMQLLRKRQYRKVHYITYQQTYQNLPVKGAQYMVHVRNDGRVEMANGRYYPDISVSVQPQIDSTVAIQTSETHFPVPVSSGEVHSSRLVIYPGRAGKTFYLAWKIHLWTPKAGYDRLFYVDARNDSLLEQVNLIYHIVGSGNVYPTTPNLSSVTTENLNNLDGSGYLRGTYANILNEQASRAYSSNNSFQYDTTNTHFDEVNLYEHITQFRSEFVNPMDSGTLTLQQITAYAHDTQETGSLNAEFKTSDKELYFGDGSASSSVNDFAKSDKVIYHEYTHAVTYYIDPDITSSYSETGAISEGDADYFAGSYTGRAVIGDYVIPSQERDMSNPQYTDYSQLPRDQYGNVDAEPHVGGEFWSSVLWALRNSSGISASQADQDVYSAIYGVTGAPDFLEFRDAMMNADPDHADHIQNVFTSKGIATPLTVTISGSGYPQSVPPNSYATWTANVSGGTSPYQYQWQKNVDYQGYWGGWNNFGTTQTVGMPWSSSIVEVKLKVTVTDANNTQVTSPVFTAYFSQQSAPVATSLSDPTPNPFNPTTVLNYSLAKPAHVKLMIYNILGQLVATLVDANQTAGKYRKTFDALQLSSGTYLERMIITDKSGKVTQLTQKLLLLK